ncbi:paraslipin [Candidatus Marinimicrobia bacterium MT.SAG.3]|nr:paraslipin [Candidatus Neomarinimicrobiota bacterium]TFB10162.1 paraslipin [Candidatus Marinimicrobia bacterium MT.SAG.3]TFB13259.1 paraslipin [Candidatus Marinimicrobia bacterium MT.SAG.4]
MNSTISPSTVMLFGIAIFIIITLVKALRIVPQRKAYIIERLGKYSGTLTAGFHLLVPFFDKVAYIHTLKEEAIDVASQSCITKDNIAVEVDGILYLQIIDPKKASYGIDNYKYASIQLAQTTMRSVMGKLDLDKTFEEREIVNAEIVAAVDLASDPWGVKVTRYEVKNITPPQSIKDAMEKQMRAEREKRATIAESEGQKQAKINIAAGEKAEMIAVSEGEKQKRINEAEGKAAEIERVATATAIGIREIASAINEEGGTDAVNLRIAEQYLHEFGKLASENNTLIIPTDLTDISSIIATATSVFKNTKKQVSERKTK